MDLLSLLGILLAFAAIIGGNLLEGGHLGSLVQLTAFVIVMGGTLGAVMVQSQMSVFLRAMAMLKWVFIPPKLKPEAIIARIVMWSNVARKQGLLGLESIADKESDDFARKGLQLLVDGSEPETIRSILEVEVAAKAHSEQQAAKIYEAFGGYAPTIGILGAVMGLIHVMNNLADPSRLGNGIATAFVATIYGVGFANLLFLPLAGKLKTLIHKQTQLRDMMIEGVIAIAEGENPRHIQAKLQGYLY